MNKLKKEILKNKYTSFAIIIFFLLLILAYMLYKFFFSTGGIPIYGNRLDGIENVKITSEQYSNIKLKIEDRQIVNSVTTSLEGKIINITIDLNENTKIEDAKSLSSIINECLSEDQIKYYDIQIYFICENDANYPMIGYKHNTIDTYSYTYAGAVTDEQE